MFRSPECGRVVGDERGQFLTVGVVVLVQFPLVLPLVSVDQGLVPVESITTPAGTGIDVNNEVNF